tara:strand:- start:167751 stop:168461 length:711 start_codon:yes stop_codon:yes gene_type:complete
MEIILALAVLAIIALVVFAALKNKTGNNSEEFSYTKKAEFLSNAERSFFGVLVQAVDNHGTVLAKVRVADVLAPKKGNDKSTWQKAFNRISAKHFDFIICESSSLDPIVAVELDDRSHKSKSASKRDAIKDSSCESAGVPLVRIKAAHSYVVSDLRQMLADHLPGLSVQSAKPSLETAKSKLTTESEPRLQSSSPSCPKCNSDMLLRESKKGKHAGKKFWGCSQFPNCRGVFLVDT